MPQHKTIRRMNQKDTIRISLMVQAAGKMDGKYWVYNEGWSDEMIAHKANASDETFSVALTADHVSGIRRNGFGRMKTESQSGKNLPVAFQRIRELEARIEALEAAITDPNKTTPKSIPKPEASPYDRVRVNTSSWDKRSG